MTAHFVFQHDRGRNELYFLLRMSVRSRSDWSEIVFQNLTTKIYPFLSHEVSIFMFVENFPFKSTNILRDVENIEF